MAWRMVAVAWALVWGFVAVEAESASPPNIVFIMADDLGYGDLGCYGQEVIQTPRIDEMARKGLRFTQAYAGSTVCAPSRCALMTGLHTGHCRVRGNKRLPLLPEDVTVAEILKKAGYATGLMGKWGLGNEDTTGIPTLQGFDEFFGYLDQQHAHTYYPEYLWRGTEKVILEGNREIRPNVAIERTRYSHDLIAEEALAFIERHKEGPFFLYLALTLPHANNERGAALGDGMEIPDYGIYADKPWSDPQKGHAAMISRLDRDVGRVLDALEAAGIVEDTLVIFTSDNGAHREGGADPDFFKSSGPLRGIKRALYEGGIRVPAVAYWPGVVEAGTVSDAPWAFWDVLPTAAELAGVEAPEGIDGVSIVPLLQGKPANEPPPFYWEFHEGDYLRGVRKGPWKLVDSRKRGTVELFDLRTDIGETNDVQTKYPEVFTELNELKESMRTATDDWIPWEPKSK